MATIEGFDNGFRFRGPKVEVALLLKAVRQAAQNLNIELADSGDPAVIRMPNNIFVTMRLMREAKRLVDERLL